MHTHTNKILTNNIHTNYTKLTTSLGTFYVIQPGNGSGLFYSSLDPHGAN